MKNKNLMILGLVVGVLMISLVSASWFSDLFNPTGNALKEKQFFGDNLEIKNIDSGTKSVTIKTQDNIEQDFKVGETFEENGKYFEVKKVRDSFLSKPNVEIVSVPKPAFQVATLTPKPFVPTEIPTTKTTTTKDSVGGCCNQKAINYLENLLKELKKDCATNEVTDEMKYMAFAEGEMDRFAKEEGYDSNEYAFYRKSTKGKLEPSAEIIAIPKNNVKITPGTKEGSWNIDILTTRGTGTPWEYGECDTLTYPVEDGNFHHQDGKWRLLDKIDNQLYQPNEDIYVSYVKGDSMRYLIENNMNPSQFDVLRRSTHGQLIPSPEMAVFSHPKDRGLPIIDYINQIIKGYIKPVGGAVRPIPAENCATYSGSGGTWHCTTVKDSMGEEHIGWRKIA